MRAKPPAGFCNVDLEIESSSRLDLLADELGQSLMILYAGPGQGKRHLLCVESWREGRTADATVHLLCSAVERCSKRAREVWSRAKHKKFDVGYRLPNGVRAVRVALEPATLARIVGLGATVAFTCYRDHLAPPPHSADGTQPSSSAPTSPPGAAGSCR